MSDWKEYADRATADIIAALTGKPDNAAAALDDALANLNRAIGNLDFYGTEPESESEADRSEEI
jgi:hypothetical protein